MATQVSLDAGTRVLTTPQEVEQARAAVDRLEGPEGRLVVEREASAGLPIPPELGRVIQQVLSVMATGGSVTVSSMPQELTTSAAAAILGVSRPTLMKMVRDGVLPAHRVGSHTRLAREDVMAEGRRRRKRQRAALIALGELEDL